MRNLITFVLLFVTFLQFAQTTKVHKSYISIQGHVKERIDKFNKANRLRKRYGLDKLSNVDIIISIDSTEIFKLKSDKDGWFELKFNLEPKQVYTVRFEKEGHYPKIIKFETNNIPPGKELKLKNWDFYLYKKIKNVKDDIFYQPYIEYYDDETGFMTYKYSINDSLEFEQNKMYEIYRDLEKNADEGDLKIPGEEEEDDKPQPKKKMKPRDTDNEIKRTISEELGHHETIEREDSILNQMKIKIHTEKAQLELDKLKAITDDDKNEITEREHEILLAETEILLAEQEIENARKQLALQHAHNKSQRYLLFASLIGLAVLSIVIMILYRNDLSKKRMNVILQKKNKEVISKNREIVDSIKYAKRLQQAILPSPEAIEEILPNSFILYLPKDIVSGDFYWMNKKDGISYFATVDCTGHGVPGAFMSIVGFNGLNQAINEHDLREPSEILAFLNHTVSDTLHQQEINATVRDGMDISLCSYDSKKKIIKFSGAYNHLYLIRNNEFSVYKADKQPIGTFYDQKIKPFYQYEIPVEPNDMLYIFTDGYIDQFGGRDGKKLKLRRFKEFLLQAKALPTNEQEKFLKQQFYEWKKLEEQVDDVLIMGLKIT